MAYRQLHKVIRVATPLVAPVMVQAVVVLVVRVVMPVAVKVVALVELVVLEYRITIKQVQIFTMPVAVVVELGVMFLLALADQVVVVLALLKIVVVLMLLIIPAVAAAVVALDLPAVVETEDLALL
tara:strand:- start:229 stop:606 length:378 start_codon:yes stop_codon:yes gene_type:complete